MNITTTYPELPEDVQKAVSELNALVNVTAAAVNPQTKSGFIGDPSIIALHNLMKMSEILQKLMSDYYDETAN